MRAPLSLLLVATLLTSLAGCSSSDDPAAGANSQNSGQQTAGGAAGAGGQGDAGAAGATGDAGGAAGAAAGAAGDTGGGAAGSAAGSAGAAGADSPAANCASTFGSALPPGFVRVDGTLVAIVRPQDQQCALPNGSHVTLQVQVEGAVYRMVTNVTSDQGTDRRVRFALLDAPLPAPAWSEGFHAPITLDYPTDLGVHSGVAPFAPVPTVALIDEVVSQLTIGAHISVYSQGDGGASTHLVHRNGSKDDGAIVVDPESATPHFLLFHFLEQQF